MATLVQLRQRYSFVQQLEVESQGVELATLARAVVSSSRSSSSFPLSFSSSSSSSSSVLWRHHLENLLWIASAAFIIYYGDFRTDLFTLLASDSRICRVPLNLGLACVITDIGIITYLVLQLESTERIIKAEDGLNTIAAAGAVPAATMIGIAGFIMFSFALWPIWSFLTLPMLITLFMASTVVAAYLVKVKLEVDRFRGLCIIRADFADV